MSKLNLKQIDMKTLRCPICTYILFAIGLLFISCGQRFYKSNNTAIDTLPREQRVRLLFAGDAMCHYPQIESARGEDGTIDFRSKFAATKPYFDRADIAIVNFETTISPDGRYSGYPAFSSPAEYADALHWLGTDVAMLANNHCCDRGARGIHSTIAKLDTLGIAHTGAFHSAEDFSRNEILRIEHQGVKFAFINYTYGTNGIPTPKDCKVNRIDTVDIANALKRATVDSDCVVACMHWGDEYMRQPSFTQRKLAQFLHRNGVDLVIGSHPHVVQPTVATDEQITVYSLGNFISNQRRAHTDGGIMAEIEVVKSIEGKCTYSLNIVPVWVKKPGHILVTPESAIEEPMTPAQRQQYELFIQNTNELLSNGLKPKL